MRTPRTIVRLVTAVALLGLAACGGGGGSDAGAAGDDAVATATTRATTTTSTDARRTDVDACRLLSAEELAAQHDAAGVSGFRVTEQEARPADSRGVVRCTTSFTVVDEGSEVSATAAVEVRTKDAVGEYRKLREFGSAEREDVSGLGEKAFWHVENTQMVVLVDGLVVIVDVGMPGVIAETNRPVAEALTPIVLSHL